KDIYIGSEYPNFVKEEPVEIKVGEKIRFKLDDSYGYMIIIENANEFLDIDSVNLAVGISGLTNRSYTSKPFLVEKKGTGEYFFRVLCIDKQRWNAIPSRIIIKSEYYIVLYSLV
ncbi:MAG: hypothetical protein OQK57_07820, partial [Ignavibacteriaceae bacterium]|nr:hypothetical protein [Ignavibacteriaceae bacterium]